MCARLNLHFKKKEEEKVQAGNELSNICPKSSHAKKKPPPQPHWVAEVKLEDGLSVE